MKHTKTTTAGRIYLLLEPVISKEDKDFDEIIDAINTGLTEWRDAIAEELHKKATTWETKMDDGDTTLYSLGLRHAVDLVLNYDPTIEQEEVKKS
jgi:hypothetical protein